MQLGRINTNHTSNNRALIHSIISLFDYHSEQNKTFEKKQDKYSNAKLWRQEGSGLE